MLIGSICLLENSSFPVSPALKLLAKFLWVPAWIRKWALQTLNKILFQCSLKLHLAAKVFCVARPKLRNPEVLRNHDVLLEEVWGVKQLELFVHSICPLNFWVHPRYIFEIFFISLEWTSLHHFKRKEKFLDNHLTLCAGLLRKTSNVTRLEINSCKWKMLLERHCTVHLSLPLKKKRSTITKADNQIFSMWRLNWCLS